MRNHTLAALILGASFIVGLAILAGTWRGNVMTAQTLKVTGSARMGVLQVTPRHSTVVSDYGVNDNSSIEKQITAVVHAKFAID